MACTVHTGNQKPALDGLTSAFDSLTWPYVWPYVCSYEKFAGVSLYWVLLGSSGHKKSPQELVTRAYTKCLPFNHKYNTQFKSFVNTAFR